MKHYSTAVIAAALVVALGAGVAAQGTTSRLGIPEALTEQAPATYRVRFDTSKGQFVVQVTREWAPRAADRFYNLVKNGFYNDVRFFRVVRNFMAQFGMHGDPAIQKAWQTARIPDDPVKQGNTRGRITFAHAGPNTRTTQVFINYRNNSRALDGQGFAAFGEVVEGMDVVDSLYSGYGDSMDAGGKGPSQSSIAAEGNAYLDRRFPQLDRIKSATIIE